MNPESAKGAQAISSAIQPVRFSKKSSPRVSYRNLCLGYHRITGRICRNQNPAIKAFLPKQQKYFSKTRTHSRISGRTTQSTRNHFFLKLKGLKRTSKMKNTVPQTGIVKTLNNVWPQKWWLNQGNSRKQWGDFKSKWPRRWISLRNQMPWSHHKQYWRLKHCSRSQKSSLKPQQLRTSRVNNNFLNQSCLLIMY